MANTTFSGPIRAGDIRDTTGTTLGVDVANVGQVLMGQSFRFTQAGLATSPNTDIVIPANSQIVEITLYIDAAMSGAASTLTVGTSANSQFFTATGAVTGSAVGIVSVTPGTDATRTDNFIDVGTTDVRVTLAPANTGTGSGVITVRYLQNENLL
jgi:hypothetical protein